MLLERTALVAVVGAIIVERNLDVGFFPFITRPKTDQHVLDVLASGKPLLLVSSLNGSKGIPVDRSIGIMSCLGRIEVTRGGQYFKVVDLRHLLGIGEEEIGVALQVNQSARLHDVGIAIQETRGSKSFRDLLHLGVAEGDPNLRHFVGCKELLDEFDVSAYKGYVGELFLQCSRSTCPHSCALDVDADEVLFGITSSKTNGVFALTATQFEHNGMLVVEVIFMPTSLQRESSSLQLLERILKAVGITGHIGELG